MYKASHFNFNNLSSSGTVIALITCKSDYYCNEVLHQCCMIVGFVFIGDGGLEIDM